MSDAKKQLKDSLMADENVRVKFFDAFKSAVSAAGLDASDPKVMSDLGFKTLNPRELQFGRELESTVVITITQ